MLNLMDAITYGQLIFPVQDPFFQNFKLDGISLYLLTTSVAQLIYPIFSSFYSGVTTCMMIENIPFLHAISFQVLYSSTGTREEIICTILMAFMISNLLTSFLFFSLAWLNLDKIIHQFPRYVLIGSLGGIGAFLMITGFETAISEKLTLMNIFRLFESDVFLLWFIGFFCALAILIIERRMRFPFLAPTFSIILLIVFYLFVLFLYNGKLDDLRKSGWLFDGPIESSSQLKIYQYFQVNVKDWKIIASLIPKMISGSIFGLVHIPINVPSFARSTGQPFFMKRELFSHGISNFFTSFIGLLPNYFVYTNSLLFMRAGASSRIPSLLLSICTLFIMFYGLSLLRFIPTTIIMFLIFYLGFELLREALIGVFGYTRKREYFTIISIIITMIAFGFLEGLLLGLFMAGAIVILDVCKFVIINSPHPRRSTLHYSISEEAFLKIMRNDCKIINFPDYSFFGNSLGIFSEIRTSAENHDFLILNFKSSIKIDMNIVEGILAMLKEYPLSSVFTVLSCTPRIIQEHVEGNKRDWNTNNLYFEPTLEDAIKFVDQQLLKLHPDFVGTTFSFSPINNSDIINGDNNNNSNSNSNILNDKYGSNEQEATRERDLEKSKLLLSEEERKRERERGILYHSSKFIGIAKTIQKQAKIREMQIYKIMNTLISQNNSECIKTLTIQKGNYLWRKNEVTTNFFYLIHGSLLVKSEEGVTQTFLNGTFVINWDDMHTRIHHSSCLAISNCTVIILSHSMVKSLLRMVMDDPELQVYISHLICV